MNTNEIVNVMRARSHNMKTYSLRMTLIYILYKRGYQKSHIATALHLDISTITKSLRRTDNLLEVKDKITLESMEILKTHILDLGVYFSLQGRYNVIKTYLKIDNTKV